MTEFLNIFDATLLNSTFRFVTPILLAALGGLLCQRIGVFNIALEGLMLTGAYAAVVGSFYSGNAFVGVLAAIVAASLIAAVFGFFAITVSAFGDFYGSRLPPWHNRKSRCSSAPLPVTSRTRHISSRA